jgi:G3E family GTPase
VDGVITLVDAAAVDELPPQMLELARRQLASADVIVFNKADLVSPTAMADVRERFTYPSARVLESAYADVPLEVVLGVERPAGLAGAISAGSDHGAEFATWAWTSDVPPRFEAVRSVLASLPAGVFRAKGFVYVGEAPEQRVVAHVVGRRVDLRPLGAWDGSPPRTELVFVSLDPGVDQARVAELLAATA